MNRSNVGRRASAASSASQTPAAAGPDGQSLPLPTLCAGALTLTNRLYDDGGAFDLPWRDGNCRLHWDFDARHAWAALSSYGFRLGVHRGQLGVDWNALQMLTGAEASVEQLPRELQYVLLGDALHPLADRVEHSARARFEWDWMSGDACRPLGTAQDALFFRLAFGTDAAATALGCIQFESPAMLVALAPELTRRLPAREPSNGHHRAAFDALRLPLAFVVGTTELSLAEVCGIGAGDMIAVEHWASQRSAITVKARIGGADGIGGPHSRALLGQVEGARVTISHWDLATMESINDSTVAPKSPAPATDLALDPLDKLPVELLFEVGDLRLPLGELRAIRPGHTFELAQPLNQSVVRILAHGSVLGRGYLVAVGDRLGVRVSEFAVKEPVTR